MNCDQICQYNTLHGCKVKEYNGICPLANVNKPMTNADKIRAMTDEELGEEPYIWTDTDAEIQEHSDWLRFKEMIEHQTTVDAVPVVRCGQCRFCNTYDCPMSGTPGQVSASDFCSYGERRTDE